MNSECSIWRVLIFSVNFAPGYPRRYPAKASVSRISQFDSELFVAQSCSNESDRCWTLATRLGEMLSEAEQKYGPRDLSYTILGVEFAGASPMIWYPGDCKHIVIQLSVDTLSDLPRACYQLAHESIHLLAPTGKRDANNLEEGLATLFGENYATRWFKTPRNCGDTNYETAKSVTQNALNKNPDFIRQIRSNKPSFREFEPGDILAAVNISRDDAEFLCAAFSPE